MHLRQNDLDTEESGALGVKEWGRSRPGPSLPQIISFGITNPPDLPWNFYNPSPSSVADNEGVGVVTLTLCTQMGVYGRLFPSLSLVYCPWRLRLGGPTNGRAGAGSQLWVV